MLGQKRLKISQRYRKHVHVGGGKEGRRYRGGKEVPEEGRRYWSRVSVRVSILTR